MQTLLQKILSELQFIPSTNNLENVLFIKLQKRIQRQSRIIFSSYLITGTVSAILVCIYAKYLILVLNNSGLYGYLHVIFGEDLQTLSLFSKEIIYVIFESLPTMSLTLMLGLLFVTMVSVKGAVTSLQENRLWK